MRVLILHNRYRLPGGEDASVYAETELLKGRGVEVITSIVENPTSGIGEVTATGLRAPWSSKSYEEVLSICKSFRPDVAHVHNFWMKLSPSVHAACREGGAATVQTLHNPRLLCLNALFLRGESPCEACLGKWPWRGVWHRCYRNSAFASTGVAAMVVTNRLRRTWDTDVDAFIALSQHARQRFIAGGLPPDRLFVKPNFVEDRGQPQIRPSESDEIVFLGRLSSEKGVSGLISAWAEGRLDKHGRLVIVGDGPERPVLERRALELNLRAPFISFVGWKGVADARQILQRARAMVLPSLIHEGFPMSIAEALSFGRPVVTSKLDGLLQILPPDTLAAAPGDSRDLGCMLQKVLVCPDLADRLGQNARTFYLGNYTPDLNYETLTRIYSFAVTHRSNNASRLKPAVEAANAHA